MTAQDQIRNKLLAKHIPATKQDDVIFVTIGVPFSKIPIMQKVAIYVDLDVDTPVKAAERLRKQVADNIENYGWVAGTNFTPAELYYEIYQSVDQRMTMVTFSENSPRRKVAKSGTWYGSPS